MDFQEAVDYIKREKAAAYAYIPILRKQREIGGTVYLLEEDDVIAPEDIPDEARTLQYHPAPLTARSWMEYQIQIIKALLAGRSSDEIMAES